MLSRTLKPTSLVRALGSKSIQCQSRTNTITPGIVCLMKTMYEMSELCQAEKTNAHTFGQDGTERTTVSASVPIAETQYGWNHQMSGCTRGVRIRASLRDLENRANAQLPRILLLSLKINLLKSKRVRATRRRLHRRMRMNSRSLCSRLV
jgi:hypothetical protein